jgi:hypothetical protein
MDKGDQCAALVKMLVNAIDYSTKEFDLTNAQVVGSVEIAKAMYLNQLLWGSATAEDLPEGEYVYEDEEEEEEEEEEEDDEGEEWKHA